MDEIKRFDPFLKQELPAAAAWKRSRLMIVDGDSTQREALKTALEDHYEVLCRPYGAGLISELASLLPGLLILDVSVKSPEAAALCKKIRAHHLLRSLPILFMTSGKSDDYHIAKPFEVPELLARIEVVFDSQPSPN